MIIITDHMIIFLTLKKLQIAWHGKQYIIISIIYYNKTQICNENNDWLTQNNEDPTWDFARRYISLS